MTPPPGIVFLISRPVEQYRLSAQEGQWGDVFFQAPLDFEYVSVGDLGLKRAEQGFVFSSQTAVESLVRAGLNLQGTACWAVGSATARAVHQAGGEIKAVVDGGGARFVAALDQGDFRFPESGVIWPTVDQPGFDLAGALGARGIRVQKQVTYRAVPKPHLPQALRQWLLVRPQAAVALFSAGGTQAFIAWRQQTVPEWTPSRILGIGPRVFDGLARADLAIAQAPDMASRAEFAKMLCNS